MTHVRSNSMFTTLIWIAPDRDFAAVVATNVGHLIAGGDCSQVATDLARGYLEKH